MVCESEIQNKIIRKRRPEIFPAFCYICLCG